MRCFPVILRYEADLRERFTEVLLQYSKPCPTRSSTASRFHMEHRRSHVIFNNGQAVSLLCSDRRECLRDSGGCLTHDRAGPREPSLDLKTSAITLDAPCAEVLAVVGQDPIGVFSEARKRSPNRGRAGMASRRCPPDPQAFPQGEFRKRYHFHRSAAPRPRQPGVMHDQSVPDIHPVVHVTPPRSHQPAAQRQLVKGERGQAVHD